MGYTHYWDRPKQLNDTKFAELVEDVKKILAAAKEKGIEIVGGMGDKGTEPTLTGDLIVFNGVEDDAHETVHIPRVGNGWDFCKTARKPYDLPAMATLIALNYHFPDVAKIRSDGEQDDEWVAGREFAQEVLGFGKDFKLED